jgi:hypothetical protein
MSGAGGPASGPEPAEMTRLGDGSGFMGAADDDWSSNPRSLSVCSSCGVHARLIVSFRIS